MTTTLYRGGIMYADEHPFATALVVDGSVISWIGDGDTAGSLTGIDRVVDLDGALVAPAFVDAHVHLLATGLRLLSRETEGSAITGRQGQHVVDEGRTVPAVTDAVRARAYEVALEYAARRGIVSVHEMSSPAWDTEDGLRSLLELTGPEPNRDTPPRVHVAGYRAQWCSSQEEVRRVQVRIPGLRGITGDVTACDPDGAPGPDTSSAPDPATVAAHIVAVAAARSRAAFTIGGGGEMDTVIGAIENATGEHGPGLVRRARIRLENAPVTSDAAIGVLAGHGVAVSTWPMLAKTCAGPGDLRSTHPGDQGGDVYRFAALAGAGVPLAFGSGAPATPIDPWAAIWAAMSHPVPENRISARAAFRAATRGGWRLAGLDGDLSGQLRVGAPAHIAVWQADHLAVQGDPRRSSWSTDARSGTPLLPELGDGVPAPTCLATLRSGIPVFDTGLAEHLSW